MLSQPDRGETTRLLSDLGGHGPDRTEAAKRLFVVVYDELRRLAAYLMRNQPDHSLQPTALVNEAYLRLMGGDGISWENRAHFFGIAASAMRQLLVDHARHRGAAKRGGDLERVPFDEAMGVSVIPDAELLDLDRAMTRLAAEDERMAQIVELRLFAAMEMKEIAHVTGVSERTVYNEWRVARMWLARELLKESGT